MHVLIVGGGLLGLTTAYFLRLAGVRVTLLERRAGVALETSFANGAMLHASQANPWNEPGIFWRALGMLGREEAALLVRPRVLPGLWRWGFAFVRHSQPARYLRNFEKNAHLARYSLAETQRMRAALGLEYAQQRRGTLKLFRTQAALANATTLCAQLRSWGIAVNPVDGRGAVALEPALAPIASVLTGGLYFPEDESGDAYQFCTGLARHLVANGLECHFDTSVTSLSVRAGARWAVRTATTEFDVNAVVLAAGSYTPALARQVGLTVPIVPVKGYSLTLPCEGWQQGPQIPVIDDHLHAAVCPLGERLRVAGTAEFAGFDGSLNTVRIENLFRLVQQLYPDFMPRLQRERVSCWSGLRPMSCDGVGIMGSTSLPGLFLNTGHGPLGWTMAVGAGHFVADEITGESPAVDAAAYRLERFARGWAA